MLQTEASDKAVEIAAALYGAIPNPSPFSSYGSHVFRLGFGGDVPDKVIKVGRFRGHETYSPSGYAGVEGE